MRTGSASLVSANNGDAGAWTNTAIRDRGAVRLPDV